MTGALIKARFGGLVLRTMGAQTTDDWERLAEDAVADSQCTFGLQYTCLYAPPRAVYLWVAVHMLVCTTESRVPLGCSAHACMHHREPCTFGLQCTCLYAPPRAVYLWVAVHMLVCTTESRVPLGCSAHACTQGPKQVSRTSTGPKNQPPKKPHQKALPCSRAKEDHAPPPPPTHTHTFDSRAASFRCSICAAWVSHRKRCFF